MRHRPWPGVLGGGIVAATLLVLWREIIFSPHAIVSGDLWMPLRFEAVVAQFTAFWNPVLEFPNVETMDRLAWMAPFLLLGDPRAIQLTMIAVAVLGSGLLMFFACRRLGASLAVACLAGVVYGWNPWIADRIQHLFLLPGYAVLPAVAALWIRPPRRGFVLWMVTILSLGSTTPHMTVVLWGTSAVLVAVRPSQESLRRFGHAAFWYGAVNLYWLLPVLAFMARADLVPSWPTWEQVQMFSRNASLAAVVRLEGYWWPLTDVRVPWWIQPLGYGLAAAFLLGFSRLTRERVAVAVLALACGVLALGTGASWWVGPLVIDGPLADRAGWLLRDPNKAVGPLAAFLLLFAAGSSAVGWSAGRGQRVVSIATGVLLASYLVFATVRVAPFIEEAYEAHPVPEAFHAAVEWLDGREGRAVWVPTTYGALTYWNDDRPTSDVLSLSSPVPVLSPYSYDWRAQRAFLTLDFGATLGDLEADASALARRWGVRWLVHHRDVLPLRLQPAGTFDNRVEARPIRLAQGGWPDVATFEGVTVYDLGEPVGEGEVQPLLTQRPTAAAAALSTFGAEASQEVAVDEPHAALERVLILPGDEPSLLIARDQVRVDLAGAAPYSVPEERWSRFGETDLAWWPMVAERGGPPPTDAGAVVTTSRPGATLRARAEVEEGEYSLWMRVYRGRGAGAIRVRASHAQANAALDRVVELTARSPAMESLHLGDVRTMGPDLDVTLENLSGANVVADLRLVPADAWADASARRSELQSSWLWPRPDSCTAGAPPASPAATVAADAVLPWDGLTGTRHEWRDVDAVELDIEGTGSQAGVEVWTMSDDVWVHLGRIHVWWQGWRTAVVPVDAAAFFAVPGGARVAADRLRVLPAAIGSYGGVVDAAGGEGLRLGEVRLLMNRDCGLVFRTEEPGTFDLRAAGSAAPFAAVVDGISVELDPAAPVQVSLETGEHRIAFPEGVPLGVSAFRLDTRSPSSVEMDGADGGEAGTTDCPTWRLWRTDERYVDGLRGEASGREVQVVATDGLMAGFWMPPGTCGAPEPRNPWRQLGVTSLVASILATFSLLVLTAARRLP